jgi:flagellar biosynthesis protein FlhB
VSTRPFPPSARRLALARRAGLTATSPVIVGALACATMAVAIAVGRGLVGRLAAELAAACDGRATLTGDDAALAVLAIAAPVLGAIALVAAAAQLAQTRAAWLPRRRIDGAPGLPAGPAARTRRVAIDLAGAGVIGAVAFGWLWLVAPRLADLVELGSDELLAAVGALLGSAASAFAIGWLGLGVLDALVRHAELANALAMTAAEKREDERLAAADPRWARHRMALSRPSVEGAAVLILGDDAAVAIAWDPARRPIPTRVAVGRRASATQLLGLARRHGVPVHRDAQLAAALVDADGRVPDAHWRQLAEIIAALRRS